MNIVSLPIEQPAAELVFEALYYHLEKSDHEFVKMAQEEGDAVPVANRLNEISKTLSALVQHFKTMGWELFGYERVTTYTSPHYWNNYALKFAKGDC